MLSFYYARRGSEYSEGAFSHVRVWGLTRLEEGTKKFGPLFICVEWVNIVHIIHCGEAEPTIVCILSCYFGYGIAHFVSNMSDLLSGQTLK